MITEKEHLKNIELNKINLKRINNPKVEIEKELTLIEKLKKGLITKEEFKQIIKNSGKEINKKMGEYGFKSEVLKND